jgi:aspartyl-tRNA synthetase
LLDREANAEGLHLDYSTDEELDLLKTDIVEMTVHAAIWRDRNDDKLEVSIMDQKDHLGLIWIVFARGENEKLATRFRNNVTRAIKARWPDTLTLPIMPTGAIPVHRDLIKVSEGYIVNPAAAARYQVQEGESKRAPEAP